MAGRFDQPRTTWSPADLPAGSFWWTAEMPRVAERLLSSDSRAPLYVSDTTGTTADILRYWRGRGYCRIIHGPGPAWWCATALGRVQLTEGE